VIHKTEKKIMKMNKKLGLGLGLVLASATAMAATGTSTDTTFTSMYDTIEGWATGSLGKMLILLMLGSAVFFSVVKPNFMLVAASIIMALVIANAPNIIDTVLTSSATL
jgi:conjugal transfer pilus assembly protein TraA